MVLFSSPGQKERKMARIQERLFQRATLRNAETFNCRHSHSEVNAQGGKLEINLQTSLSDLSLELPISQNTLEARAEKGCSEMVYVGWVPGYGTWPRWMKTVSVGTRWIFIAQILKNTKCYYCFPFPSSERFWYVSNGLYSSWILQLQNTGR